MTIDPQIQQLSKQDFVEYLIQLKILAKEKYSFDIFIENRLSQVETFPKKRQWNAKGKITLKDNFDITNLRESIYDDDFYKHITG